MSDQEQEDRPEPPLNQLENLCKEAKKKYEGIWWVTSGIYIHAFWPTNKYDWAFEIRHSPTALPIQGGLVSGGMEQSFSAEKDYKFFVELLTK